MYFCKTNRSSHYQAPVITMDQTDINAAVAALRKGETILYPTDTVWGLGCDATNPSAVREIFRLKQRDDSKALITLVSSVAMLERWVDNLPDVAFELIEAAVRPITIVFDSPRGLAPELLAADGSAAVRVTADPFCRALIRALRRPLVSTSANISGHPTPRSFAEISPALIDGVRYAALDRRDAPAGDGRPSTVIKLGNDSTFKIIRP